MFVIQLGHPKVGVVTDKPFDTMQDAFMEIFSENEESAYLFWHDIPIRLRYREDLYANFNALFGLCWLVNKEKRGATKIDLMNQALYIHWDVFWTESDIRIESRYTDKEDPFEAYAQALNEQAELNISKPAFFREWKTFFHQIILAFKSAQVNLQQEKEIRRWEALQKLEGRIPRYGVCIQKSVENYMESYFGDDSNGFYWQVGLIEGIRAENKSFASLAEAYHYLFRTAKEYAILLWNGIPVRFSYQDDIPFMVEEVVALIQNVLEEPNYQYDIRLKTPRMLARWEVSWDQDWVELRGQWQKTEGNYQAALNAVGPARMPKMDFLAEWTLLIEQLVSAFDKSRSEVTENTSVELYEQLKALTPPVAQTGRFYRS